MTDVTPYEPSLTRLTLVSMILFTAASPKSSPSNNRLLVYKHKWFYLEKKLREGSLKMILVVI
jgi:hypothetical protein